jgi:hypothetical protein
MKVEMKNKRNRWIAVILLLVIICIGVTACGSSSSIVGRWQHIVATDEYMEFFSDGRIELENADVTLTGTYEIKDDQLGITIQGMFEESGEPAIGIATFSIEGDILTFIQGESATTYRRVE